MYYSTHGKSSHSPILDRYYLAAAKTLQRHKMYSGKLEFLPATHSGHAKDGVRCWAKCKICQKSRQFCQEKGFCRVCPFLQRRLLCLCVLCMRVHHNGRVRILSKRIPQPHLLTVDDIQLNLIEKSGWSEGKEEEEGWKSCSVKFHSIMSIPLTGRTRLKPEGDLPYTHLADGTTELLVFSECTRRWKR